MAKQQQGSSTRRQAADRADQVRSAVEQVLDSNLPESYDRVLFREKCDNVFYLMLDYASHGRKWAA